MALHVTALSRHFLPSFLTALSCHSLPSFLSYIYSTRLPNPMALRITRLLSPRVSQPCTYHPFAWMVKHTSIRIDPDISCAGLTLEQHMGYIRKATMEAPTEIKMFKVRAIAARTLRAWKTHRDPNHNKASSHDVQGSAPGQERQRTRAFQTRGRRESMEALWGLAAWWHEQQLTQRTFWTAGILDEI